MIIKLNPNAGKGLMLAGAILFYCLVTGGCGGTKKPLPTLTIKSVISPTSINSQTITGTKSTNAAAIIVTCSTATVGAVSYPMATTWSCALINLSEGNNVITARAKDSAGNTSSPVTAGILLRTQGPSLKITSPQEGQVIRE